jgi:DNA-binding response OmpR family regulator
MALDPRAQPELLRVLLVEDDHDQEERLVALLKELGCVVDVARDGGAAVRQAMAMRPHVVLMDLGLPLIDGWQAIRLIRPLKKDGQPHVIALSGFADARSRQLAFEAGCDEYIVKPFDVRGALRAFVARRPSSFTHPLRFTGE